MTPSQEAPPELPELLRFYADAGVDEALEEEAVDRFELGDKPISPLAGEMPGRAEGGVSRHRPSTPSVASGDISPTRGEISRASPLSPAAIPDEAQAARARGLAGDAKTLEDLHEILGRFDGCNLKFTAKNLVFADGNPLAKIMFVGEAPGREEDLEGRPFVGRSGQLLDRMLAAIGLDRESAYIANVIPWRPPGNRAPTPLETEICRPFIERQIELVNPKLIVMLGGSSAKALLKTTDGIMRLRGTWRSYVAANGVEFPAMPTLHPAYLLRTPAHKKFVWRDLLEVKVRLREM